MLRERSRPLYDEIEAEVVAEQPVLNLQKKRAVATNTALINKQLDAKIAKLKKNYESPTLWNAWCYLKKVNQRAWFTNNKDFLDVFRKLMNQYFSTNEAEEYQNVLNEFLGIADGVDVTKMQGLLNLKDLTAFKEAVKKASKSEALSTYLNTNSFEQTLTKEPKLFLGREPIETPLLKDIDSKDKDKDKILNLAVLASSEPELAQYLKNTPEKWVVKNRFSQSLFNQLITYFKKEYITKISDDAKGKMSVGDAREPMIVDLNSIIGKNVLDIQELITLTDSENGIIMQTASWGSIFEHWVRKMYFSETIVADKPFNEGKATFYIEVKATGIPNTDPEALKWHRRVVSKEDGDKITTSNATAVATAKENIKKADTAEKKKKAKNELAKIPQVNKRVIDCSYYTPPKAAQVATIDIILLELKHVKNAFDGEVLEQLKDNVALINAGKIQRMEYLFSTEDAAKANQDNFQKFFVTPTNAALIKGSDYEIYFVNASGVKTIFNFKYK